MVGDAIVEVPDAGLVALMHQIFKNWRHNMSAWFVLDRDFTRMEAIRMWISLTFYASLLQDSLSARDLIVVRLANLLQIVVDEGLYPRLQRALLLL